MKKPVVFIGSSTKGEFIAYAIQENLEKDADVQVWTQGIFELGSSYLESLIKELDTADFAILVLTEDDITISRNHQTTAPRDNVLFELGLFMGRLGRDRSFFVYDKNKNLKIPSDLSGISGATFAMHQSGNVAASLGAACNKIRKAIMSTGPKALTGMALIKSYSQKLDFCNKVTGYWWERIRPDNASALSFVNIAFDEDMLMLKMKGRSFNTAGEYISYWETKSTGINFKEEKIFYFWEGWFPSNPSEPYEGVGEIKFYGLTQFYTEGNGIFSNINIADIKSMNKSSFELTRSNEDEEAIMYSKNKENIARLVIDKLREMF